MNGMTEIEEIMCLLFFKQTQYRLQTLETYFRPSFKEILLKYISTESVLLHVSVAFLHNSNYDIIMAGLSLLVIIKYLNSRI